MKNIIRDNQLLLKKILLILYDIAAVAVSGVLALLIRFELDFSQIPEQFLGPCIRHSWIMMILTVLVFYAFRLYTSLWTYAGAVELMNIVAAGSLVGILQVVFYAFADIRMPRSYYLLFAIILIILVFASRYSYRGIRSLIEHVRGEVGGGVHRVMVVGGGAAGNVLIKEIRNSSHIRKKVVCVIDDAQSKIGSYIHGVKIMGNRYEIPRLARELAVDEIIIAMPAVSQKEIKGILDICKETGCELKRLPGIYQLVNGDVSVAKLKDVDVNDLLGREPIQVDLSSILGYVSGKTVLVTGGGGEHRKRALPSDCGT